MHLAISKRDLFFFWQLHFVKVSILNSLLFSFWHYCKIIELFGSLFFPLSNFSALILLLVSLSMVALKFLNASRVWSFDFRNYTQVLLFVINEGNEIACPSQGFDFQRFTNAIMYEINCLLWSSTMFLKKKI
jgi:hypothetical protein